MDPTQTPTQEPIQSTPEIITPQPNPSYLKTIIFSILLIITFGLIAYLIFQNQKLQKQVLNPQISPTIQTPSPTPKTVSSISIPSDETANWKTYIGSKYLFKYPQDWLKENSSADIALKASDKKMSISLSMGLKGFGAECEQILKEENLGLDGVIVHKTTSKGVNNELCGDISEARSILIAIKDDSKTDILSFMYNSGNVSQAEVIFDQILSTFKFTDQNNSICPDNYRLYENKVFSICGPLSMTYTIEEYPAHDRPEVQAIKLVFEDDNQRINIMTAFTGGWGGGYTTEKTLLDQHQATKLISKDKDGNFSNLIVVTDDQQAGQFPIVIDYQRKNETFSLNEQLFQELIQSFKLK